jgi:hypothetical protein
MQYQLIVYDVWGNTRDGYEVNAAYTTANYIELNGDESDGLINRRLNVLGVINARGTTWAWESYTSMQEPGHTLYGTNKSNGKPVCELRAVEVVTPLPVRPSPNTPDTEGAEAEAQRVTWQGHIDDMRAAGWLVVAWTPQELRGVDTDYMEERVTSYGNVLIHNTAEEDAAILAQAEEQLDWVTTTGVWTNDSDDDFTRGAHDL